jgi:hypothetical protein
MDIPTRFIWNFFYEAFEYGGTFERLRWIQNLHQSTWDHEMVYADRSSKGPDCFCEESNKKYEHGVRLSVRIHILCSRDNWGTAALTQLKFCTLKVHGLTYNFYLNVFLCLSFSIRRWRKILGYVGTNTEPLCVGFCNFVQCHTFVDY